MIVKTILFLSVAAFVSTLTHAGEPSKNLEDSKDSTSKAPANTPSGSNADPGTVQPKLELPKELQPVDVKASEDEIKKFEAMLENIMKSEKGLEIMQKLQMRAQFTEAKHEQETRQLLDANRDKLVNLDTSIVLGNPKGTVTLVLVADPLCPNCRVLEAMLRKVIKQQPSLRVILHQWAFVNPEESARVAGYLQAAYKVDSKAYTKLYEAFLSLKEVPNQKAMEDLIAGAKYDLKKVKDIAENAETKATIEDTRSLAKDLKFPGVPILMAIDPEGRLMLVPPVSEQELVKIVSDLTKAVSSKPQAASASAA